MIWVRIWRLLPQRAGRERKRQIWQRLRLRFLLLLYGFMYSLEEGSRIYQALEAAGGTLEEGDSSVLNLAMPLSDGMRIEVPGREDAAALKAAGMLSDQSFITPGVSENSAVYEASPATGRKVNLNQASAEELMTLTGIGSSRAEAIIRYRQEVGPFRSIEDVMNVSGIKESAFEKIRKDITV